ncbi:MAG TPA: MarR family winged helix-turn-helix transcriptional regulator [Stackebrandtia sp.]|uniref:MarR family winged helix-turn-helix transcriptional regulator n=1 Tax=Stackebrandtia sp. TaxID=2023065 RepID=UPI002D5DD448|nr:MarR family winged helix-turn-helix transcriptional regulator [Stackebrandtia sp.]HZE40268.1 MarR family winged helix-turn-helix transcriptional regulator [Stackebrandtia sp.]
MTESPHSSASFQLGVLGGEATERFARRIADLGLKPKQVGVLIALHTGAPASQLELARRMHVAPSLMVALADQLEELGAIGRERDAADRRRQVLTLTDTGRRLLDVCAGHAAAVDDELTAGLNVAERRALRKGLTALAGALGYPVDPQ